MKIRSLTLCALFTALLTVSAFLRIPLGAVSLTFQLQICLLSAFLLKERLSAVSVLLYLGAGFLGLPVFTAGGGLHYFTQPTAGYLLALLPCALVTGLLCRIKSPVSTSQIYLCFLPGLFIVEIAGSIYCLLISALYLDKSVFSLPFILSVLGVPLVKDLILSIPFAYLGRRLIPLTSRE